MPTRSVTSMCRNTASAAALALAMIPLSPAAGEDALKVKVLADRYVAAGHSFANVAALAAWSAPIPIRALSLETCGPSSTRHLLAAVERFQSVYADGIRIRALRAGDPSCASAKGEYLATDGSGRSMLP
jgi:hypothetical protein